MFTPLLERHTTAWGIAGIAIWIVLQSPGVLLSQTDKTSPSGPPGAAPVAGVETTPKLPSKVDVEPVARDSEIQERLLRILKATGWFTDPQAEVRDGVVSLSGTTQTEDFKRWAGDLANNTQDVAAVVNRIQVRQSSIWDLAPARAELRALWTKLIASLPYIGIAVIVLIFAWWASRSATSIARRFSEQRIGAPLLRDVFARATGVVVLLTGVYFVLHVSGLTRIAVTVVGGTGLLGLIIGIAFHDITENFLASLFLALQQPFQPGDLVTIAEQTGFVHSLTTRTTILMTLDGNHIQIPNSTVYKSTIQNFASNPNRRESFLVGIGYAEDVAKAQSIALQVLKDHPAVLGDPQPWVLVDSLGSAAVTLRVYFWMNGREHSWLPVKSSVIRLLKVAFDKHEISIPFEARSGLSQSTNDENSGNGRSRHGADALARDRTSSPALAVFTEAEGDLRSQAEEIHRQSEQLCLPETEHNLLPAKNTNAETDGNLS